MQKIKIWNIWLGMVAHIFNAGIWEAQAGRSLRGWGQSGLHSAGQPELQSDTLVFKRSIYNIYLM